MFRVTAAVLMLATPAFAENPDCAVFGEIAQLAVAERQAEADMTETMVKLAESYTGDQQRFAGAVPLLVDWVWGLPEEQLGDDVGEAYQAACDAQ